MGLPVVLFGLLVAVLAAAYFIRRNASTESYESLTSQVTTEPSSVKAAFLPALPRRFIVLDLETTGLDSQRHEIIEFGAIRANMDSNLQDTFQTLVKPKRKVPRHITEINGISQAMVDADGIELADALNQFVEFAQDLPIVAFNADFDMRFLLSAAIQHGHVITNRYTCALRLARRAWPGLPSYRLSELAKRGKLSDENTHRALGDCKRTLIIFTAAASEVRTKVSWVTPKHAYQQGERRQYETAHP